MTELILGELLAKTVEHAPGLVEINIDWSGEQPTIRIPTRARGSRRSTRRCRPMSSTRTVAVCFS